MGRVTRITLKLGTESNEIKSDLFYVFSYIGLVESLGNSIVDLLVLLLVANGRDFHIECLRTTPRIKHALTIEDLEKEKVPLTTKLNFMRDNNLRFIASLIDTDLRNTIAHLKFETREAKSMLKAKREKACANLQEKS
jgi:hypothetical protein